MALYGNGSDGALNVTSGPYALDFDHKYQFTTVNVGASGSIVANSAATGSVLYILATTSITIDGAISTAGYITTRGKNTWSVTIDGVTYTSPSAANGGAGGNNIGGATGGAQGNGYGGGGAGGTNASTATPKGGNGGAGGTPGGSGGAGQFLSNGGGISSSAGNNGGTSAGGGGAITVYYGSGTSFNGANAYSLNGQNASSTPTADGGGGGGSGGQPGVPGAHIVLKAPVIIINGSITTFGGSATGGGNGGASDGNATGGGGGGGGGGGNAGNLYLTYSTSLTNNSTGVRLGGNGGSGGTGYTSTYNGSAGSNGTAGSTFTTVNNPPTSALSSPADGSTAASTTPTLTFSATDADSDAVTYQVQISTDNTFTSTHTDVLSTSGTGFSGTDPYTSGASVTYTVQTPLTTGGLTYYWRVRAKDPAGSTTWGAWTTARSVISPASIPSVTSGTSSAITETSATTGGDVTSSGGSSITERGIVYATTSNPTTSNSKKTVTGTTGSFTTSLTGLTGGTTYHWRPYAINSVGTAYGTDQTLTTLPVTPTITTIHDVTSTAGQVDAEALAGGGVSITERGVVYATTTNPTTSDGKVTSGTGAGTYTASITGLTGSTKYYVRAYAINSQGTSYSVQTDFTTSQPPGPPTVTTGTVSNITATTADVNTSEVTLDGTQTVTERGVVFSDTSSTPTIADRKSIASTTGLGTYTVSLTGLTPETLYYARAYATNSLGTGYGSVQTLTTIALFAADAGDGYWVWNPNGSDATVSRSQATLNYSSANLLLEDLGLENGEVYTFYYSAVEADTGEPSVAIQRYNGATKIETVVNPGVPYSFTYDTSKTDWAIRLFVTGASSEADNINAAFRDMYLAKESTFSGYVPFVARGLTEIKLENNWLLDGRREDTIQSIFDIIHGVGWRPFQMTTVGMGWIDVGDQFTVEDDAGSRSVIAWNTTLTIDGGIKETLSADPPEKTETDYNKAGTITKSLKRTQITVDKNEQTIESLVEDVYDVGGVLNTRFSEIEQTIDAVRTTVQSSGGVNLVKNSVMYSYSDTGVPDNWTVDGTGTLTIQASPESISAGGISGNVFVLSGETVTQTVSVRKDMDFIVEADKQYYSFSARVRKNTVGDASIILSNRNETHTITLPDQTEYYWEVVQIEGLLPLDDHFDIEIYSDTAANLQVTDVMLSPGENVRQWTQSNGEAMNTSVAITDDGMTIRSNVFRNDYTKIDALGFEVHKHEAGGDRVFGFNGDETGVKKLKADDQISLAPIRMIPINYSTYRGVVFTRTEGS